ncbi:hypothetical protein BK809_0007380 [Diplodia seriata]|uniref:GCN5-related N-acetyltransferase Rv2170-like domain-containing protein n=1 Tax=Diplodia seriata TaxID=420778 RepID=A0A1S8BII5_9PEZI|nr:hypothetical protein BK809_0007380 [Diplodia seriata]
MVGPIAEGVNANPGHSLRPQIHDHTESPEVTLLPHLHYALPYTLPLYRRIQFGHRSQHTRVLATVPAQDSSSPSTTTPTNGEPKQKETQERLHQCFAATYTDRSRRPETESWLYVSWDHPSHSQSTSACTCGRHLLSLLSHIATGKEDPVVPYPALTPAEEADIWAAVTAADARETAAKYHTHTSASAARYLDDLDAPAMLKVGTMHATGVEWARGLGLLHRDGVGTGFAYRKYVFYDTRRDGGEEEVAEKTRGKVMGEGEWEGLRWGTLREEDLAVARSRTAIPRTNRTLRTLPSVAVFAAVPSGAGREEGGKQKEMPVAWAVLAVDGSLSSLHVEPEYRGKGLAKAMGRKIFQEGWDAFGDDLNGLAHADVALENAESNGVCKSLGGTDQDWHVYWVRIDLDRVREIVSASP